MINIDFLVLNTGDLIGFEIKGHSGLAENGQDILCAAVSSAAYMTVNTISDVIKVNSDIKVDDKGFLSLIINDSDCLSCRDILLGFKIHMLALEEQYPGNITVNYTEV